MQLTIIKKNKLNVSSLPEQIEGNQWIIDWENGKKINLLNVEADNGKWKLISNQDAYAMDNKGTVIPEVYLDNYAFYLITNNYKNETFYLYCSPVNDDTFREFGLTGKTISVGSAHGTDITYKLNGIPKIAFNIEKKENGFYYLSVMDDLTTVYVNKKRIVKTKRLEYGDIIFLFGLKLILLKHDTQDYLLVNNPNNLLEFSTAYVNVIKTQSDFQDDNKELPDDSQYTEKDYFYRTPRFYRTIEPYKVSIDSPPGKVEEDKTPAILTIGPTITMSMTSIVMLGSSFLQVMNGYAPVGSLLLSLFMLASSLFWPFLTKKYQKWQIRKTEKTRQKAYKKYLEEVEKKINEELLYQKTILNDNYFTINQCQEIIKKHDIKLWQRRISDADFLTIPFGRGNVKMNISVGYPEEHFSLYQDDLLDMVRGIGKKDRILTDVPITYSLFDNAATGIVGDSIVTKALIDRIILEIMTCYSYDEVKIVTLTTNDNENDWDYVKTLPHSWSNDKSIRYFGSSNEEYREIMFELEKIYNLRRQGDCNPNSKHIPHYVIVTDAIKSIDNYDFLKSIMASDAKFGFSVIMLVDKLSALPNECKNFVNATNEECEIFRSLITEDRQKFKIDFSPVEDIYNCALELANIPIDIKTDVELNLPDVLDFLEMYQVGKVEQLNSLERWKKSNPILSLQAPIGLGKNGDIVTLDLHEKYHGPHGLIAGTTGSGKSEFIITYITSMAINYNPNEVQFILIDYKGGSLTGAFSNDNYELPHLAGTITNLDGNELNRSLASIESELKNRQRLFNDAKNLTGESTMDIYKYQKLYREGRLDSLKPIAHLIIISDEFAELKEQQPEFMDKLISVARVGRALGVHLILATQKPGGVVDSQIWSNSRFKVCLKVQDSADSQEVLKKPDAAYLKKTGRFYLQVGYDEVFMLGQSAWAGSQYYPSATFRKYVDTSISEINNIGYITVSKNIKNTEVIESHGEEVANIVKYLNDLGINNDLKVKKLWLPRIPERIYIDNLKNKYNFQREVYSLNPIIGEYDDPDNQVQNALSIPFTKNGNAVIYGIAGSGKENLIRSLVYSLITSYAPQEVNCYIMDFGSETLKLYERSPYVGDVFYLNESDKTLNLFKMLNDEIEKRKKLFSEFGGSYSSYVESGQTPPPNIVVILNNFEAFTENYEDLVENLIQLTRDSYKYGIFFTITASSDNSIRMKLKQNLSIVYALQQNNDQDYSSILGNVRGKAPLKYKGRGLFRKGNIYEFQTAYITEEKNENAFINELITKQLEQYTYKAERIPVLPNEVNFDVIHNYMTDKYNLCVGVDKATLNIEKYNINKNTINVISSSDLDYTFKFVKSFISQANYLGGYRNIHIINTSDNAFNIDGVNEINKKFDDLVNDLCDYIDENYKEFEASNYDESVLEGKDKYMLCVYGVYDFINRLSDETRRRLSLFVRENNQILLSTIIFVDTADLLKVFAYEDWFKGGTDLSKGIWIGGGLMDQSLFKVAKIEKEDRGDVPKGNGYILNSTRMYRVKLLSDFTPKDK